MIRWKKRKCEKRKRSHTVDYSVYWYEVLKSGEGKKDEEEE